LRAELFDENVVVVLSPGLISRLSPGSGHIRDGPGLIPQSLTELDQLGLPGPGQEQDRGLSFQSQRCLFHLVEQSWPNGVASVGRPNEEISHPRDQILDGPADQPHDLAILFG
jgi:hypothetical protein